MGQEFECAYKNAQNERKKSERLRIEKTEVPKKKFGLLIEFILSIIVLYAPSLTFLPIEVPLLFNSYSSLHDGQKKSATGLLFSK